MTTTNSTEITIRGRSAIAYAKAHGLDTVEKYADPTEGARVVTLDEAEEIARQDPSLLWVEAETEAAIGVGDEVEAGEPGTEDHDTGRVLDVDGDAGKALVGWTAGVKTWTPIADLRRA